MNSERFAKMKPDAVFINTSRGGNVDEDALANALKNDVIGGAAIDAFADEPLPADLRFAVWAIKSQCQPIW